MSSKLFWKVLLGVAMLVSIAVAYSKYDYYKTARYGAVSIVQVTDALACRSGLKHHGTRPDYVSVVENKGGDQLDLFVTRQLCKKLEVGQKIRVLRLSPDLTPLIPESEAKSLINEFYFSTVTSILFTILFIAKIR